jgi:site-specific DNA-methyltransferase (adenine-specific)
MIVWNKKFKGSKNEGFFQGFIEPKGLRNYQLMVEYCLFYTFQGEGYILDDVRDYLIQEKEKSKLTLTDLNEVLVGKRKSDLIAKRYFGISQWEIPTEEMYLKLQSTGFWQKSYSELDKNRYTYNNQKTHHSVWNYEIASKIGHVTPKPVELIENIIKHSSNEGDIVLDCCAGSMTTAIACINTNRDFIVMEKDEKYFLLGSERVNKHIDTLLSQQD